MSIDYRGRALDLLEWNDEVLDDNAKALRVAKANVFALLALEESLLWIADHRISPCGQR